jgi:hypothetical protein
MDNEFKENKLYEIFIDAEDFCKSLEKGWPKEACAETEMTEKSRSLT